MGDGAGVAVGGTGVAVGGIGVGVAVGGSGMEVAVGSIATAEFPHPAKKTITNVKLNNCDKFWSLIM